MRPSPRTIAALSLLATILVAVPSAASAVGGPDHHNEIVINEIMQNPAEVFDSLGEWFELYNPTDTDVDIDGWTIADEDFDEHVIDNGGPLVVPAGGYLVLGRDDVDVTIVRAPAPDAES